MFRSVLQSLFKEQREEEINKARQRAKEILLEANEEALKTKKEAEQESRRLMSEAMELEKHLTHKEKQLEKKEGDLQRAQQSLEDKMQNAEKEKRQYSEQKEKILVKLESVAKLSKTEARELLLKAWEDKLQKEIADRVKEAEDEIEQQSTEKAKQILVDAMRYGATDYVSEYTLSVVSLPNDSFKGRIIGKDGRNIRAFELATGVDVDLEEEGVIRLSSFDAVRREVARISLERLIKDGRIQPPRIEEIVKKVRSEVDKIMFQAGKEMAEKVGVYKLPQEITQLLGHFKYRYSYGQNMILHTLEETRIGIALAHELKADVNTVKLGCLLHDIGKVVTDKEGSHVDLGVQILKKYRFPEKVIDCVAAHHEDIPFPSIEAVIVYIADAVSGGRPGARHEDFGEYLKRIETIEKTAQKHKGVRESYALQAGRELRVIVEPENVSDDEATIMSKKIKDDLEETFDIFPGQIRVSVIREYRAESVTKI